MLVHWITEDGGSTGQIYAQGLRVGSHFAREPSPSRSLYSRPSPSAPGAPAGPEALAQAVRLAITCDASATLGSAPVCLLPVTLNLRNTSDMPLAYNFSAAVETADTSPEAACRSGGHDVWLGTTRLMAEWLPPNGHVQLHLHAALTSPGTIVLRGLQVSVCGWRDSEGAAHWVNEPALCAGPAPRLVNVMA